MKTILDYDLSDNAVLAGMTEAYRLNRMSELRMHARRVFRNIPTRLNHVKYLRRNLRKEPEMNPVIVYADIKQNFPEEIIEKVPEVFGSYPLVAQFAYFLFELAEKHHTVFNREMVESLMQTYRATEILGLEIKLSSQLRTSMMMAKLSD